MHSDQFSYGSDVVQPQPYGDVIMHTHYSSLAGLYSYFLWRYVHTFLVRNCPFITKLSEKVRHNKVLDNHACSTILFSKSISTLGDKYVV